MILDFVVEANPEHQPLLRALLRDTKVTALCPCGCGSPNLTVDQAVSSRGIGVLPSPLPGEAAWKIDGLITTAMLFIDSEGASLEINHAGGPHIRPGRWPRIDELEVARWEPVPGSSGHRLANFSSDDERPMRG